MSRRLRARGRGANNGINNRTTDTSFLESPPTTVSSKSTPRYSAPRARGSSTRETIRGTTRGTTGGRYTTRGTSRARPSALPRGRGVR